MDVRAETLQERKGTRIESLEMDKGGQVGWWDAMRIMAVKYRQMRRPE